MKIAFAIPTYNRLSRLQVAIESIRAQQCPPGLEIEIVLSNSASTDGTTEYIDSLINGRIEIPVHCWNSVDGGTVIDNFRRVALSVPGDVEWVWFLGDDDYIVDSRACARIAGLLQAPEHSDVAFVHAAQARRASSSNNESVVKGTCFELCKLYGLHELLGWMSSLIVRRHIFQEAIVNAMPESCDLRTMSAFSHSTSLFELLVHEQTLLVDEPLVEPQDLVQSEESIRRWAAEEVGERYYFLLDDLKSIYDRGVVPDGYSRKFFRYLTYSLWDRLGSQLIAEVLNREVIDEPIIEKFKKLEGLVGTFEDKQDRKMYQEWISNLGSQLSEFAVSLSTYRRQKQALTKHYERLQVPVYDFKLESS